MLRDTALLHFYEVARTGSVRRAAERLHVSPSAISRMITKIEHRFQADLFERRAKGMHMTPAGQVLFQQIGGIVAQLNDAQHLIDAIKGLRRGEVSLHCMEGIVQQIVPNFLTAFHREHPNVTFTVNTGSSDQTVEALLADTVDIGITFNLQRNPRIEALREFRHPLYVLAAPTHPLAARRQLSLREVSEYPIAMVDPSFGARRAMDRALRARRISASVLLTSNSLALTYGMVIAGSAVTLSSPFAARRALSAGEIVALPITDKILRASTITVCKRRGRVLSPAARELIEFINHEFDATITALSDTLKSRARRCETKSIGRGRAPARKS